MSAVRARIAQRGGQGGFVIMAGLAAWLLVGGVVMTALLGMTLSVAQQARVQREGSQAARAVDGALEVGVTQLQVDRTGKKGVPTGKGDGSCRAGVGSNGGDLVIDAGTDGLVVVTASCSGPAAADQVHRVVLTASATGSGVVGSAALAVVAAPGGGNDVVVDSWTVDDRTAVTTTTSTTTTTVKPTTTTSTSTTTTTTSTTTTTVKPTSTTSTSTTTTAPSGVTWAIKVQSDWGTGYCADVTVSNPTKTAIDWTVKIPIEGRPYTVWNANWSQTGQVLTATGVDWNRTVQPGGTQPFGFCNNR
ncbi:cellulose binding domain-containing protein [Dermatobacter hominis]|uniref:cellulose binding domain-containing protein n=1 Tax=Dermatobacter hominis TaxID=2884263 RepID=UPI001D101B16|nr:cellulose binding domain-containing protein [Dermatobacter hominis]UDY34033.1 cellulose binding domain-containing protein [Dermatobacter hominis]